MHTWFQNIIDWFKMITNYLQVAGLRQKFGTFLLLLSSNHLFAEKVIQPKQYISNNQEYTFTISPLSPDGLVGAEYSLSKGKAQVWSNQLSSTAVMADVSSDGQVIICTYSKGLEPSFNQQNLGDYGYMEVTLFDAGGNVRWSQSTKRRLSMGLHKPPSPY